MRMEVKTNTAIFKGNTGLIGKWLSAGLALWFTLAIVASGEGWLGRLSPYAIPPIAFTLMAMPALLFWAVPSARALVERIGVRTLTAVHGFRILAVPLFFWYGGRGLLPKAFVDHAGWGDLISGTVALGVVAFWARPAGYWVAHVIGMVDFLVAFGTAMAMTRADAGAMHAVTGLPMALIPFFFVGVLGSTHLMTYDLLLRGRHRAATGGLDREPCIKRLHLLQTLWMYLSESHR